MSTKRINPNSATPIRNQFASVLLQEIEEGVYPPGNKIPSERSLAEKYGISRTSVRECIAQFLSQGILSRAGRGTFVPEHAVKMRSTSGAAHQIGFWIGASIFGFVQPGYNQIMTGAGEVCSNRGYRLQFHPIDENAQSIEPMFTEDGITDGLDGNLVVGGVSRRVLGRLRESPSPLLLVDLLVDDESADAVRIDYSGGIRQAVGHLGTLGHEAIGFIGFPDSRKYESFWQSLEACGLRYDPRYMRFLSVSTLEPGMVAGYQAMQKLIAGGRLPTAIQVTNDYVAVGVLEALAIAGLRVPEDISIVGCDDLELTVRRLTTIQVDLAEVGRTAARALLDRIEKGAEARQIIVPAKLVIRGTTAPPPK